MDRANRDKQQRHAQLQQKKEAGQKGRLDFQNKRAADEKLKEEKKRVISKTTSPSDDDSSGNSSESDDDSSGNDSESEDDIKEEKKSIPAETKGHDSAQRSETQFRICARGEQHRNRAETAAERDKTLLHMQQSFALSYSGHAVMLSV